MSITLENRLRQMQVFNLDHTAYCQGTSCCCSHIKVTISERSGRTGEHLPRQVERLVPGALTLLARERRPDLPDTILRVPEVRAAIAAGTLRVVPSASEDSRAPARDLAPAAADRAAGATGATTTASASSGAAP